ncbi:ATP-dependent helicase [Jeotgalibacillus proteolyticus]|uniref:DNA 3'-5' helicase n=1 Tax=Jeotgalibacillus proteolyticus TaxID=2082395 RepID=A0A2S5GCY1_9BACL|nr:ATP-dependent helicase [Jeotgalibacillus proteolyticus]PPA70771.1 DNA helicase UvrD [Jeotgalibacillus proteolyticus]
MIVKEDFFLRKFNELNVSLNAVQKQAVQHTKGALLLLASPGSGKTTTIIMRIGYLIEVKGAAPDRIKGVTFSKASAEDMKTRFSRFFPELPPVDFSTIHSLAFSIVRDHCYQEGITYTLIEGSNEPSPDLDPALANKKMLLRNLFQKHTKETITDDQLEELTSFISFIKNKLLPRSKWSEVPCEVPHAEEIASAYEEIKAKNPNRLLLDYDDMLTLANDALKTNRRLLKKYQNKYDYVLTDESQDTSLVQHAIIEKLVKGHGNLCVVADDDQSIYTWRAAEPQYLIDFKKVYPKAEILMMEQNYRSTPQVVDVANQFIKRNKNRYDKNMFTENEAGEKISIKVFPDYEDQSRYIGQQLAALTNYSDAAVLYRTNSSAILLMNELDRAKIPFYMKDSDHRFFSHWIVEDILNFMRLTFNEARADIFEQIHTKCKGYITKQQMAQAKQVPGKDSVFDKLINHVQLKDYQIKQIKALKQTFHSMKNEAPYSVIKLIRERGGYDKALENMSQRLGFSMDYLKDVLMTLEEIARKEETMKGFAARLKHLESLLKTSKFNKNKNAVTLSTLHSSKGLEFKNVYMMDLIADVIPSKSDQKESDEGNKEPMEEAARLFYVGMTRAEEHLELLSYRTRNGKPTKPSMFLLNVNHIINPPEEMEKEPSIHTGSVPHNPNAITRVSELQVGRIVKHRVFGRGEILGFAEEGLEIRFSKGTKKLSIEMCLTMGLLEPEN